MSWTVLPVTPSDVRSYLDINATSAQFNDATIGSNIRAAASFIQRTTGRQFEAQTATKKFTTDGKAYMAIPDLRTASSVTLQGTALTADSTYYFIPDQQQSGVYIGIQFRAFGGRGDSYLANPEWFDRNLDRYSAQGRNTYSLPNDLSITGEWGHQPLPHEFLHAVKILAGFYTRRPASVLADAAVTPEGTELRYSQLPVEVRTFIGDWTAGTQLASVG
jgi:hypothetical protein